MPRSPTSTTRSRLIGILRIRELKGELKDIDGLARITALKSGQIRLVEAGCFPLLTRGLLVIVGEEAVFSGEIAKLDRRDQSPGRLPVDVDVNPAVNQPQSDRSNDRD